MDDTIIDFEEFVRPQLSQNMPAKKNLWPKMKPFVPKYPSNCYQFQSGKTTETFENGGLSQMVEVRTSPIFLSITSPRINFTPMHRIWN